MAIFRIRPIKSKKQIDYVIEELVAYFKKDGHEPDGRFRDFHKLFARCAERIGADASAYYAVMLGMNPDDTALPLGPGAKPVDFSDERRNYGSEILFAAPKSISLLWAAGDNETKEIISAAVNSATEDALQLIENDHLWVRSGAQGVIRERAKTVWPIFQHHAGRPVASGVITHSEPTSEEVLERIGDPHLHFHIMLPAYARKPDGSFGAVDTKALNGIVASVQRRWDLGFRERIIEHFPNMKFVEDDHGHLQIAGIDRDLQETYSKRSLAGRAAEREEIAKSGDLTREQRHLLRDEAIFDTDRLGKNNVEVLEGSGPVDRERWWAEDLAKRGLDLERVADIVAGRNVERDPIPAKPLPVETQQADALKKLFETESVVTTGQLNAALLKAHLLHGGIEQIEAWKSERIAAGELIEGMIGARQQGWTTREMVETEESLRDLVRRLDTDQSGHLMIDPAKVEEKINEGRARTLAGGFDIPESALTEQEDGLRYITTTPGLLKRIEGVAGAGKTQVLSNASDLIKRNGGKVIAIALGRRMAQDLGKKCGCESTSVKKFLIEVEKHQRKLDRSTVIFVDESGQLGVRQTKAVLEAAEAAGAKVIFTGDQDQVKAIEAGPGLGIIAEEAEGHKLQESVRARETWAREASTLTSKGRAREALEMYAARGQVHLIDAASQVESSEATRRAALADHEEWKRLNPGSDGMVMGLVNRDVDATSETIRREKIQREELGEESRFFRVVDVEATRAEAEKIRRLESDPIEPREILKRLELREGDIVRFGKNDNRLGVVNSLTGRVLGWGENDEGEFRLRVGVDVGGGQERVVSFDPDNYRHLRYAYTSTVYGAQGATVDRATVLIDSLKGWKRDLAYVAGSRARGETHFYINRKAIEAELRQQLPQEERRAYQASDEQILDHLGKALGRESKKLSAAECLTGKKLQSWEEADAKEKAFIAAAGTANSPNADTRGFARLKVLQDLVPGPPTSNVAGPRGFARLRIEKPPANAFLDDQIPTYKEADLPNMIEPPKSAAASTRRRRGRPSGSTAASARTLVDLKPTGTPAMKALKRLIAGSSGLRRRLAPLLARVVPRGRSASIDRQQPIPIASLKFPPRTPDQGLKRRAQLAGKAAASHMIARESARLASAPTEAIEWAARLKPIELGPVLEKHAAAHKSARDSGDSAKRQVIADRIFAMVSIARGRQEIVEALPPEAKAIVEKVAVGLRRPEPKLRTLNRSRAWSKKVAKPVELLAATLRLEKKLEAIARISARGRNRIEALVEFLQERSSALMERISWDVRLGGRLDALMARKQVPKRAQETIGPVETPASALNSAAGVNPKMIRMAGPLLKT